MKSRFLPIKAVFLLAAAAAIIWIGSAAAAAGTAVIDADQTYLYFVLGDGKAIRYGIGVGGNPLGARMDVGTKVVVLPNHNSAATIAASAVPAGIAAPRTYNTHSSNIY